MAKPDKNALPGQGGRFAAMKQTLSKRTDVQDPGALSAFIGRKKYKGKFQKMAAAGKASAD